MRMRNPLVLGLCAVLLCGCPLVVVGTVFLWPEVQNQYPHPVQYEMEFTNGSSRVEMVPPCTHSSLWATGEPYFKGLLGKPNRKVFVQRLTVRKDGVAIATFDGEEIERPWREDHAFLVIDETGLRAIPSFTPCFLVLNTLAEDVQARAVYRDRRESLRTWKACEPAIWADRELAPPGRRGNQVDRLVVSRTGDVLHQLERSEFRALLKGRLSALLAVDESGIRVVHQHFRPGQDVRSLCVAGVAGD